MWKCPKCNREFRNGNQNHSCNEMDSVDAYIAGQPAELQPLLHQVRKVIRDAAPDAVEKMAWRMPTFWQGENLIHFAACKKHIGLYPGDLTLAPFDDRLAGYRRTKGAIQFPLGRPIDFGLIADITRWRVSRVEG